MPAPPPPSRRYATGAWLDLTTITLMIDASLARSLVRAGSPRLDLDLDLAPSDTASPADAKHPLLIDLARVRDGRPEPGGVDQHAWSEAAGAAWGAGYGALTGALFGPLGAAWGASLGASFGRGAGRAASERAAATLGTYNEVMTFIPSVTVDGRGKHLLSLGMHTDSPLSKRLSEIFRSGFGKRMAIIDCRGFTSYDVLSPAGARLLSARFTPLGFAPLAATPGLRPVVDWLSQPVLGLLEGGALATAHVDRAYHDPAVRVASASGSLVIEPGFLADRDGRSPPAGAFQIGSDEGATAFQATYVPVKLDFPSLVG